MPFLRPLARNSASQLLTLDQMAEVGQVGERLLSEFQPLFDALPTNASSGLGMARYLELDRGTCTRFANTFGRTVDGVDIIRMCPGVRGMRQVLAAMSAKNAAPEKVAAATAAIDRFERLISDLGGSQTKLLERLTATLAQTASATPENQELELLERRRDLFQASANVLGQHSDLYVVCQVFRPSPGTVEKMDHAVLRGNFGYRARRGAPPYTLRAFGKNHGPDVSDTGDSPIQTMGTQPYRSLAHRDISGDPDLTVLENFSTIPPPLVSTRGPGRASTVLIDTERTSEEHGLDIVVGQAILNEWRLPQLDTPATHEVSVNLSTPCSRFVFDVYLHRSMAQQSMPPTMKLYRTTPGIFGNASAHWFDQLPYPPALKLISGDPTTLHSPFYPRQAELITDFFSRLNWDLSQFVGYRIEVEYPHWSGYYSMLFDYTPQKEQA